MPSKLSHINVVWVHFHARMDTKVALSHQIFVSLWSSRVFPARHFSTFSLNKIKKLKKDAKPKIMSHGPGHCNQRNQNFEVSE